MGQHLLLVCLDEPFIRSVFVLHGEQVNPVAELFGEHWPTDAPLGGHQGRLRALDHQL